jgi:hypothetical protein
MHHRSPTAQTVVACLAFAFSLQISFASQAWAESFALRADLPYLAQQTDPIVHDVDFSVVVTPPYHCQVLKVWLPLPPSDAGQQIVSSKLSTFPDEVVPQIGVEPIHGNQFAYFEFHQPQGAQIIRHQFRARVCNLVWQMQSQTADVVEEWPAEFAPYLQQESIARQAEFDQLLGELVPRRRGAADDLFSVMQWVNANLVYDHVHGSLRADPNHAFEQRRGHCSDYHGLCAAMGRKLGYPTRVTYGLGLTPRNSPSHCKLEAFVPPYGWVSFDVSETQKLVKAIREHSQLEVAEKDRLVRAALRRLQTGFRENSWLLLTKGTLYELAPKASQAVQVVRTIYAEADGRPLPDPDPANVEQREFAWMTVHKYSSDKPFVMPFKDLSSLAAWAE